MARSKRQKLVSLTKTTSKKSRSTKEALFKNVAELAKRSRHIYLFSLANMRNAQLKELRSALLPCARLFFGKSKVMIKSLDSVIDDSESPLRKMALTKIVSKLTGVVGLLMVTDFDSPTGPKSTDEIEKLVSEHKPADFARAGFVARETVTLEEGILKPIGPSEATGITDDSGATVSAPFGHSMEPQLRALGLPTKLVRGAVHLLRQYTVCERGSRLTHNQAHILKHLGVMMSNFRMKLLLRFDRKSNLIVELATTEDDIEELDADMEAELSDDSAGMIEDDN